MMNEYEIRKQQDGRWAERRALGTVQAQTARKRDERKEGRLKEGGGVDKD